MNLDKQRYNKKKFYGKLVLLVILIVIDVTGVGERTKIEQMGIIDKYYVETNTRKTSMNSSIIIPEHYRYVFLINNKEVEIRYFGKDHENFNINDKVTVEYKIPMNIFKKPYITSYDFN
ncbi:hypothetical protein DS745_02115 [Anaerobacillus alkaliphilus]|uniref:Uncharacterized protein n=1 Tax=Anaerobacillus alkaliphilus TaxID=1548597 RepID=A0A4Q0VX22_9BACI|nr:hypothetical protein [Anaerobacillus alkaliphilus]RXJ04204.1 hypothetical protein DS745_02115 [Anaerobacillus alkaliphilus]